MASVQTDFQSESLKRVRSSTATTQHIHTERQTDGGRQETQGKGKNTRNTREKLESYH